MVGNIASPLSGCSMRLLRECPRAEDQWRREKSQRLADRPPGLAYIIQHTELKEDAEDTCGDPPQGTLFGLTPYGRRVRAGPLHRIVIQSLFPIS
jgi:hypothetical protein